MTLLDAIEGTEYIVQGIITGDEELNAFLFSLGCYSGEPITVVALLHPRFVGDGSGVVEVLLVATLTADNAVGIGGGESFAPVDDFATASVDDDGGVSKQRLPSVS